MSKILDQYGQPIELGDLIEPQTARVAALANTYLTPMLDGLTPAKLARILKDADNGDLLSQHRLFADMEERDPHLMAEMGKRRLALLNLDWDIVAPHNASAAEKAVAQWVKEVLTDAVDPIEDLILACMEGVGHGYAGIELEWCDEGRERLPSFHPRPQEWLRLSTDRRELRLSDSSPDGGVLQPFGWVLHTHGKAKTGYIGRMGLHRVLVWPFLYKTYALGDFAEFLETYGLPIIVGKYYKGASADEKASLMRAVTRLGHDARAIMPADMTLEINEVAGGGAGSGGHLDMMNWCEKSQSKCILGATLTSQADGKSSTNALGNVHNEVRHDILDADARQIAATLTRDLIYPLIAINRPGILDGLRRCPRFAFDTGQAEDLKLYAEALPKLIQAGMKTIPVNWVHEKLRIPVPQEGDAVLSAAASVAPAPSLTKDKSVALAALAAKPGVAATADPTDPVCAETATLARAAAPPMDDWLTILNSAMAQSNDLADLQNRLTQMYGMLPSDELTRLMSAAFALAELKGMADVQDGR